MEIVLITGAAGFIGTNLRMNLPGRLIISVDRDFRKTQKIERENTNSIKNEICIQANIKAQDWFELVEHEIMEKADKDCKIKYTGRIDTIFHLASLVGVDYVSEHPNEVEENEIEGMKNIIIFAKKHNSKVIYSSTSSVNDKVKTAYNKSKRLAEQMLISSGIDYVIIRYYNVYGPYQKPKMVIARFIESALKGAPIVIHGDGNQTRDFSFIDDIISATINSAATVNRKTLEFGTGKETKIIQVAEMITSMIPSSKSEIAFVKPPLMRLPYEVMERRCVNSSLLSFSDEITDLKSGLIKTVDWFKTNQK